MLESVSDTSVSPRRFLWAAGTILAVLVVWTCLLPLHTQAFGSAEAARKFIEAEGGRIVGFDDMPRDYILASSSGEK